MIKKIIAIMVVLSMTVVLLVACAGPTTTEPTTTEPTTTEPTTTEPTGDLPPIKIGALIPYTGPDPMVLEIDKGIKMKLDEVGWEVAGRKVELVLEDTAYDPEVAVTKAKKLVEVDNVDVVLGALYMPCSVAVGNYLLDSQIPQFPFVETPLELFPEGTQNFFCVSGNQDGVTCYLGDYAYDVLGYRTASVMYQDFLAGVKLSGGFMDAFKAKGGEIVQTQAIPMGTMDYAPYVTAIKKADCFACWLLPQETIRLLPVYFSSGLDMPFIQLHGSLTENMLQASGDDTVGMVSILRWALRNDTPENEKFIDSFKEIYGEDPHHQAVNGYETTSIFLQAVEDAAGDTSPAVINDAIRAVKIELPSGVTSFTPEGVGVGDLQIIKVENVDGNVVWVPIDTISQVPYLSPSAGQ